MVPEFVAGTEVDKVAGEKAHKVVKEVGKVALVYHGDSSQLGQSGLVGQVSPQST